MPGGSGVRFRLRRGVENQQSGLEGKSPPFRRVVHFWIFPPKTTGSHGPDEVRMGNLGTGLP